MLGVKNRGAPSKIAGPPKQPLSSLMPWAGPGYEGCATIVFKKY